MMTHTYAPGSVIRNRSRLWRVDGQEGDVLVATAIDGGEAEQTRFYVPFEDIQPGRLEPPSPGVVGHPSAQDLLLRAYRLSLLHGTAPLISLQRSRVIPKDYQLVPVVMALEMPRVRMLIADDVGLGKTIEAGLIVTELLARQMAARVLVIVPANLREQWREALDYFFHIPARVISTRHRREMERELPAGANPWEHYRFLTATPHNGYTDSFASLLRMLDVGAVTGPVHDPEVVRRVAERYVCQRRREDVEAWFQDDAARGRAVSSPFPERDQDEVIVPPTAYEMDAIRAVETYGQRVLQQASAGSVQARTLASWTVMHLHKRALSSPEALRCSLHNRRERLKQQLERQETRVFLETLVSEEVSEDIPIPSEVARANVLDEDTGERLTDEEAGQRTERVVYGSADEIRAELELLEEVLEKAQKVTPRRDSKLQKLLDTVLRQQLAADPKVVIFSRYVDTMNYLAEQIGRDERYAHATVLTIHGGLNERQRREVFMAFERARAGVLVATDAISEGINLQHAAAQVIHYELPWNPNRLEQRNGRVDRFGQRRPVVTVRTMVMDETLDAAILKVLVEKAARIRRDYGFSPPYFGDETSILDLLEQHDVTLGPRQLSLFDTSPSPSQGEGWGEGKAGGEGTPLSLPGRGAGGEGQDPFSQDTLERIKEDSFYGQTHVTLPEIERRLAETAATVGSPEQIQRFVFSGLDRFGCSVTENADGSWRIAITEPALQTASVGDVIERATFDPEWALDDPDVTLLDVGHPLVRRLIEAVKQQAFVVGTSAPLQGFVVGASAPSQGFVVGASAPSQGFVVGASAPSQGFVVGASAPSSHYGRTAYVVTPDVEEVTALFHLLARYVVNTDPTSIVEELLPVAVPVYGGEWDVLEGQQPSFTGEEAQRLLEVQPSAETRTGSEVREVLADALSIQGLERLLEDAVEARRHELVAERRNMRQQMEHREGAQVAEWLHGIDDLSSGSFDLLAVTVLWPE